MNTILKIIFAVNIVAAILAIQRGNDLLFIINAIYAIANGCCAFIINRPRGAEKK